jgi:LruC domain-containing protein
MERISLGSGVRPRRARAGALVAAATLASGATAAAQSVSYYPSELGASLLAFEDQWPTTTDYDYNDVLLQVHWAFDRDLDQPSTANGLPVLRALATIDPVALGGDLTNGLGLRLPASLSKVGLVVRRRLGTGGSPTSDPTYGAWEDLTVSVADAGPTVVVSTNLRELFGGAQGPINAGVVGQADRVGQRIEVAFDWPVGVDLDTALAPFDVFIFRTSRPAHEIHQAGYGGTAAMDPLLFPVGNGVGRWYVNDRGIPAALNLKAALVYPTEATRIEGVYPDIVSFAQLPNFASWSGTGDDPRLFYQRAGGEGGRKTRGAAPRRPTRAAIVREACTEGLEPNRQGRRVRAGAACVEFTRDGATEARAVRSCRALQLALPSTPSGAYYIDPDLSGPVAPARLWCDMSRDGGGWTLIAKHATAWRGSLTNQQWTNQLANPIAHVNVSDLASNASPDALGVAWLDRPFTNALWAATEARIVRMDMPQNNCLPGNVGVFYQRALNPPNGWDFWAALRDARRWGSGVSGEAVLGHGTSFSMGFSANINGNPSIYNAATDTFTQNCPGPLRHWETGTLSLADGSTLEVSRHGGLIGDGCHTSGCIWYEVTNPAHHHWKNLGGHAIKTLLWVK